MPDPMNPIGDMLAKFGGMKQKLDEAAKAAAQRTATVNVGGGMVSAIANGKQEIVRINIDPQAMGDKAMLEDLIAAACNQALAQTKGFVQEEMQKVVAQLGLPLPPGFDISKLFG
ncbi:MAG: YbaB/EbfC family nucleoid-associated protein [Deltaproteobacteria bacterium]|nr:YbaB/EbfC family nucleoid-associated protein [Deltaproteobacteria bacterium]